MLQQGYLSDLVNVAPCPSVTAVCLQAKCEWNLTTVEESGLNSVVFAGMCVGAPVWGFVSDSFGRKTSFFLATLISAVFGFATAAAPNFHVSASSLREGGHVTRGPINCQPVDATHGQDCTAAFQLCCGHYTRTPPDVQG